ncbi:unnamed protein product [Mesocestoides corti]|nr:unnamed protein product [Mesocestoides corti]
MVLRVVSKVRLRNGTAPSVFSPYELYTKILPLRTLAPETNVDESFMICESRFDESVHLGMVSVSWNSPQTTDVGRSGDYFVEVWRDEVLHRVGSKLGLRSPSYNQSAYGRYTCIFEYKGAGLVKWDVYLNVAPILTLSSVPPPPPLLASALTDPRCTQRPEFHDLVQRWRQACRVVLAYPPVAPSNHFWNWSNAENAVAVIRNTAKRESANQPVDQSDVSSLGDCPGLVVRQNASVPVIGPTVFWCYAENEIGPSGIWWPHAHDSSGILSSMLWWLGFLAVQIMCGVALMAWWFRLRRRRIYRLTLQEGRVLDAMDARSLVVVGPDDAGEHLQRNRKPPKDFLEMQSTALQPSVG